MTACVFKFTDFVRYGDDLFALVPHLIAGASPSSDDGPLAAAWSVGPDGRLRRVWRLAGATRPH